MRPKVVGCLCLALVGAGGCGHRDDPVEPPPSPPCKEAAGPFRPLSTRCGHFVDLRGRVVVMRGVNARVAGIFDVDVPGKPSPYPVPVLADGDLARMRRMGFDLLRLPIHWSAIEPTDTTPPTYDAAYLDRVAAVVSAAKKEGLRVLIDFHQDAWSKFIGEDGAPLWAIVPAPAADAPRGDILSPAVQNAFRAFFSRTSADGTRLRARYAAMAAAVAKRFLGEDAVVAIELMNEPMGSDDELRAFHEEVAAAIGSVDPSRLVAFEPPATRNLLDRAKVPDAPSRIAGSIYAPHVYTHAFTTGDDSAWRASFGLEDLRPSNESARAEADGWKTPLLVTEFGWDPKGTRFADYIGFQLDLQDEYQASSVFWVWKEKGSGLWGLFDWDPKTDAFTERADARKVFARVFPRAISGWPISWRWDGKTRSFELRTIGDVEVTAPTVLHLPDPLDGPAAFVGSCDGSAVAIVPDSRGDVEVVCGGPGQHVLLLSASPR